MQAPLWLTALTALASWLAATTFATAAHSAEHVVHVQALAEPAAAALRADGSRRSPFPTIEAARDHLRALRSSPGRNGSDRYRVVIGAGTYPPLQLERQDSGTPGHPIIYEADPSDGPAIVSGGLQVPRSAFQPWAGHPGVVKADVSSLGVDYGSVNAGGGCGGNCSGFAKAGLVFANRSMVLARWPNVDAVTGRYVWERITIGGSNGFSVVDPVAVPRMAKWAAETKPMLHSYAKYDWSDTWNHINISASSTEVNVTIADKPPSLARVASRSLPPQRGSIRFRLAPRTYAPWGCIVRVVSLTKPRQIPTRNMLPLLITSRRPLLKPRPRPRPRPSAAHRAARAAGAAGARQVGTFG